MERGEETSGWNWRAVLKLQRSQGQLWGYLLFDHIHKKKWGFPSGAVVKSPPANTGDARDMGSISGLGRSPGVKNGQPTPVFLPGKSHGQRSLVGYSPWGHKAPDMTEHARSTSPSKIFLGLCIIWLYLYERSRKSKSRKIESRIVLTKGDRNIARGSEWRWVTVVEG